MKRKVLKVGNASLAVSLPSKWVKEHGIRQSDELEVSERDGELVLNAHENTPKGSITIDAPEGPRFVRRVIISPYVQGYDEIIVNYKEPSTKKAIDEVLANHLIGFEITQESRGQITLQNVATGIDTEFNTLYRRIFHIITTMGDILVDGVTTKNLAVLEEMESYSRTLQKLHNFCRRILNIEHTLKRPQRTASYRVICELEGIGDYLMEIKDHLRTPKQTAQVKDAIVQTMPILTALPSIFFAPTVEKISQHAKESRRLCSWLEEDAQKRGADAYVLLKLSTISHRCREMTVEIMYPFEKIPSSQIN